MNGETVINKLLTDEELANAEEQSRTNCQIALNHYLDFPTQFNGKILLEKLDQFQTDWMNGRIRDV